MDINELLTPEQKDAFRKVLDFKNGLDILLFAVKQNAITFINGEPWHFLDSDPELPHHGEIVHVHTGKTEYNQTYDGTFTPEVIAWQRWTKLPEQPTKPKTE